MELLITNDDGSTSKFTEEMAVTAIKERDHLRTELARVSEIKDGHTTKVYNIREQVYNFFNNEYSAGETELTFQVEDINQMLQDIGANVLKTLYTVHGTISFTITDVEADSEDDAISEAENEIRVVWDGEGDLEDWSIEITRAYEQ
jgi:hypothetical protein